MKNIGYTYNAIDKTTNTIWWDGHVMAIKQANRLFEQSVLGPASKVPSQEPSLKCSRKERKV